MRSFLVAISAAFIFILSGWGNAHFRSEECRRSVASIEQANPSESSRKLVQEWSYDMLRTAVEGVNSLPHSWQHSSQQSARQRHNSSTKTLFNVSPRQHLGHVTNIINLKHNLSSQSNEYYLHTLCRLRI